MGPFVLSALHSATAVPTHHRKEIMKCDCVKLTEENAAAHYKEAAGDDVKATCLGMALVFGETIEMRLFIPFLITGSKRGFNSAKGKTVNVFFNYCPFCGQARDQAAS